MSEPVDPRVHAGEPRYGDAAPIIWETRGDRKGLLYCSYCGSLSVPDAIRLLKTPGTKFSGTDKIGYKLYIAEKKFYVRHLRASPDDELLEFDVLGRRLFGYSFRREGENVVTLAPRSGSPYGFQTYGTVGAAGEPLFGDGSSKAPTQEWWDAMDKREREKQS